MDSSVSECFSIPHSLLHSWFQCHDWCTLLQLHSAARKLYFDSSKSGLGWFYYQKRWFETPAGVMFWIGEAHFSYLDEEVHLFPCRPLVRKGGQEDGSRATRDRLSVFQSRLQMRLSHQHTSQYVMKTCPWSRTDLVRKLPSCVALP